MSYTPRNPDKAGWVRFGVGTKVSTLCIPAEHPLFREVKAKGAAFHLERDEAGKPIVVVEPGAHDARVGFERFRSANNPDSGTEWVVQIGNKYVPGWAMAGKFRVTPCEARATLVRGVVALELPKALQDVTPRPGAGGARKMPKGIVRYQPPRGNLRNQLEASVATTIRAERGHLGLVEPPASAVDVGSAEPCQQVELEAPAPHGRHLSLATVIKAMNRYKDKHGDRVQFSILDNGHIAADVIVKKRIGE